MRSSKSLIKGSYIKEKALLKKITETRENKEVYKFWTRSKTTSLERERVTFLITV